MTQPMTRADLVVVSDRYLDAVTAFHTPEGIVESPMFATLRGRKAIEDAQRAFFASFPDAATSLEATVVDPPHVAMFLMMNATHVNEFFGLPGTGRHIEFRLSRLLRMEGDLIAHETRIYDFTGLLVQVGVLRAKPAKP